MEAAVFVGSIGEIKLDGEIELVEDAAVRLQDGPAELASLRIPLAIAAAAGSRKHTLGPDQEHRVYLANPTNMKAELLVFRFQAEAVIPTYFQREATFLRWRKRPKALKAT